MRIRGIVEPDALVWPSCLRVTLGAPAGMESIVGPAEALLERVPVTGDQLHIPWQPDELDIARLAHGGTVWLTVFGGLPPHRIDVLGGKR